MRHSEPSIIEHRLWAGDTPQTRGWCPSALRPMQSGDGWLVRISPPHGELRPAQAAGLAAAARRFGNGQLELSNRANLQLRGVRLDDHGALLDDLARLGLMTPAEARGDVQLPVVLTPFHDGNDGMAALAADLAAAGRLMPELPSKFGLAVDAGPQRVLAAVPADIRIERKVDGGLMIRADGASAGRSAAPAGMPALAAAIARWFVDSGGVTAGRGRMAAHLAAGHRLPAELTGDARPTPATALPQPGPCPDRLPGGLLVGLPFGALAADGLERLADTGATLRLTPWRMLLLQGVERPPAGSDLIMDPTDPLLRVAACIGAPGCVQAQGPTRPLARALARQLPEGARLHVAGCSKGCAHPGPADITLVASQDGYGVVPRGRAGDPPARLLPRPATGAGCDPDPAYAATLASLRDLPHEDDP
ncbi:precorrin-3B synthase [Marinibaculum pumilum]|uniref:Precorrin-3B synthase n=1 Tax=Marinibaculum pumilum TaxID=1766165 RepID=A0ABV7KXF5_9PROT